jgi:hypothetical protein
MKRPMLGGWQSSRLPRLHAVCLTFSPWRAHLETFNKLKNDLLKSYKDKFALIHGEEFVGAFDTPDAAYQAGINKFEKKLFLVKRISEQEEVYRNQALALGLMHARI